MTFKHTHGQTVDQILQLEVGFAGEMSAAGLSEAIVEALEKTGIIEAGGIVYLKASSPGEPLTAVEIWAPEPEPIDDVEPPTLPGEEEEPEPNV